MQKPVDVNIAFYGKPYQAIVTIESLMRHSGQHIDKIYLSRERIQPHGDWVGIFKIIDLFRDRTINGHKVNLVVSYPHHFLGLGVNDYERAQTDHRFRQSIMYQYALETTDKKYMCVMHNDMLFHGDMIGEMLRKFSNAPSNLAGIGSIGQCWSCPAGPDWGNLCHSEKYEQYKPTMEEAVMLQESQPTPRQAINLRVLKNNRVHPLPECRLNEYCALIDVEKYRKNTLPDGTIGCYGGGWNGTDTATVWSHDMYQRGYTFQHLTLENYVQHAAFDETGSGTSSNSNSENYFLAEKNAEKFIKENYYPLNFSPYVRMATFWDSVKRDGWLTIIHAYGALKRVAGKS
ncbi:hypothetical protein [Persicitalea jodogahamensis]|nr:hypothetical protein [Persicitalea jodogahamensis]